MTRLSPRRRVAVALLVGAALGPLAAGCGSGRSGLTAVEQNQLLGMIEQARTAAVAGNATGAQAALTELRSTVSQLRVAGVLDPARAARMQSVAAQAQSAARGQAAAPAQAAGRAQPPAPAPATPAAPAPAAPRAPAPAPTTTGPVATIIQGAGALKGSVDKGVGRLKHQISKLQQRLTGQGAGQGGGGGGGGD